MVATTSNYISAWYQANPGDGYDGVVRVVGDTQYGTGALLQGGRVILTASHVVTGLDDTGATVWFETTEGTQSITSSRIVSHPDADSSNGDNDLALIWLETPAPLEAERYDLYRGSAEVGETITLVGYGIPGDGDSGTVDVAPSDLPRLIAENTVDALFGTVSDSLQPVMAWTPDGDTQFIADFDDGSAAHDALGLLAGISDTGLSLMEGLITTGDSGGPAFIDGQVAGVATLISSLESEEIDPDVDFYNNSSFGEIAFWQRVGQFQQWIDQTQRTHDSDAPATAAEVALSMDEGNADTTLVYFMVEFTGDRDSVDGWLSVDYATRDGTALAGEDYVATSGTLVLYEDESQAVIAVEVIGDTQAEANEVFYLDITNPQGGSFDDGVEVLTAQRIILDDDGIA